MAASIPVLRTLFRDITSLSRRYYISTQENNSRPSKFDPTLHENIVTISSGTNELARKDTGDSEKEIMRESQSQIQIFQTKELAVEFHRVDPDLENQTQQYEEV